MSPFSAVYSAASLSASSPVSRWSRMARMASACIRVRLVAALASGSFEGAAEDLGGDLHPHQPRPGLGRVGRRPDHADDLVDVRQRDQQAFDDVGPLPGLAELVLGPPTDHVDPVVDEEPEEFLERERPGPAVDQGQHDHAERVLQRRVLKELVEDDVGVLAPS